ncbi:peptidylprolyl isomerase [Thiofilum flexile]|uniref:peptidylprolyl isomerase n=1 Tax=Thiofilum flexile TaxID=125627 RepID=UPI00037E3748
MKRFMNYIFATMLALVGINSAVAAEAEVALGGIMSTNPKVLLETSKGNITIELDAKNAPISTENFLGYVRDGFYNGLVFHRVIPNFMIQGGGMHENMHEKTTKAPIRNEANNGLKNMRGTLAMARTSVPHSASSQFFINTKDNDFLNFRSETPQGWGYAVFGKVVSGMDVVDAIEKVKTGSKGRHEDVPVEPVTILKATEVQE